MPQTVAKHRDETGSRLDRVSAADARVVVGGNDLEAGEPGEVPDGLGLALLRVLVLADIGLAGGPQIGNRLDQTVACHGPPLIPVTCP